MPSSVWNGTGIESMNFSVAFEHFGQDRDKAWRYINKNLAQILHFAENPVDSLRDGICMTFGDDGYAELSPSRKKDRRLERIRSMASCVYGDILRHSRPWYRNPIWHVHHWEVKIPLFDRFNRWAFSRCCKCGGRFKWGESPTTDQWDNDGPKFLRGERNVYHSRGACSGYISGRCDQPHTHP